jgi:SNF2 family DNA or RNA helicase
VTTVPKLHDYQREAVAHLQRVNRAALWLDMGLGKTAITLSALEPRHLPALVVAPARVAREVWPVEQPLWRPDLTLSVATGSPAERARALAAKADITVISREVLADVIPTFSRYNTLVIDESSGFKNRASARVKTARKLVPGLPHVWELTGTPSPNGYMDLWAQIFLLDGGKRLGKTITAYRDRYFKAGWQLPNGVVTDWTLREGADEKINALVEDICLSMSAEGRIDLPPITYNDIRVPLSPATQKVYDDMEEELIAAVELLGEVYTASGAGTLSGKLSQITAGFLYSDEQDGTYGVLHHSKVQALQEILEGTGSPVLCFYRFKAERELITKALPKLAHTLDEPEAVKRWNAGDTPLLLAHPASAGHGLNLQYGGHTTAWTTLPWSLEEWQQGNGRLHRQGQKHPVVVHSMVSPSTIDQTIKYRLNTKSSVQQALLDYVASVL